MGKYGPGLTINDVCKLEVKEAKEILEKYKVSDFDVEAITDMIKEAYYQFSRSATCGRAVERLLEEMTGKKCQDYFQRYMELNMEEAEKFPFDVDEEDEETFDEDYDELENAEDNRN